MPQPRKKAATSTEAIQELTDTTHAATDALEKLRKAADATPPEPDAQDQAMAEAPVVKGYLQAATWVVKTAPADLQPLEDGADPLWINCNVSGVTNNVINWLLNGDGDGNLTWADVWGFLAPRIRAWNALAYDIGQKAYVTAPAPRDAGTDIFNIVGDNVSALTRLLFISAVRGGGDDRPS